MSATLSISPESEEILKETDPETLRSVLAECLGMSAQLLIKASFCVERMDQLGIVIDGVSSATLSLLRRIFHRQVSADLYIYTRGKDKLFQRVSLLPIDQQEAIARGEPVRVMCGNGDHRMVAPMSLTSEEIDQVFGRGFIRDDSEQVGWRNERSARNSPALTTTEEPVAIDARKNGVVVNGYFLSKSRMHELLASLERLNAK